LSSNNFLQEENPAIATITITAVKVPELTEQSKAISLTVWLRLSPVTRAPWGKSLF
jgi:hypothetical protein